MISDEYAAGFFDGEGCVNFTIRGKAKQAVIRVMLVNTNINILLEFQERFGGILTSRKQKNITWKDFNCLTLNGHFAIKFLSAIRPYVHIKHNQIELAFEYYEWSGRITDRYESVLSPTTKFPNRTHRRRTTETIQKEQEFKDRMHTLNKKGIAIAA